MECTIHRNQERSWKQLALTQAAKRRTPSRIDPSKTTKASQWVLLLSLLLAALSNAVHQAHAASTLAPVTAPSAPTTPAPTPMPTLCLSSCPAGQYNKEWLAHLESGTCKESGSLSCLVCPGGFFKTSGNSWTACSACGGPNAYCKSGKRSVRSSALCTYRADVLTKFNADGTLAQSVAVENQEEEQYNEQNVRDSQDTCGTPSVTTPTIDLQIIKPASSVTKVTIANSGSLPLLLHDFILPSWITLFDNTKGSEVSDEAQLSLVVAGKASSDVYLLVKSSDIPSEDLVEADDFDTSGVTVASTSISFEASQVISTPGIASVPLEADVTVEISEPSLSLLPSENTWSISIGSIERRTLALYNVQVKKIDWVAEVVYNSEETTGWLAVSPTSGSLEQGFKCTSKGEVISTNGVNKAEVAVTVDGTSIAPGSYTATIRIKQSANQALFSVTSAVKLEVLPGDVEAQETVFEWEVTQVLTDTTTVLSVSETGEDRRRRLKRQRRRVTTVDGQDDDDEEVPNEVYLPNTELTILPRDRFGIDTNQFANSDTGNFNVTWWGISAEASDSGTIYISRNPIDNTFVGDLDIRQKGTYMVEITMSGSGEHIKGSPLSLQVHPRICLDTANSESHPVSGYTCVCSAGYGKTADSQACEPCPAGQHRDESMLTVSPYCRSCDLGMYQDETASATCKYCPLGHQPNAEQTACEACQDSYVVDVDSPARNCVPCGSEFTVVDHKCVCKPEFYWADAAKTHCAACPVGAFCGYGDRTTILPLQGYWRANWDPMHFEPCPVPESCLGVTEEDEFILRIPEAWASFVTSPYNETWYVDGTASTTAATSTPAASSSSSNSQQLSHTTGNRRLSRYWGLGLASQVGRRTEAATRSSGIQDSDTASQSEDGGDSTDDSDVLILPAVQEMNGCAEGQAGPLCKECAPGYYPLGTGAGCAACDSLGSTVGFFLLSIFAGFGALGYLITRTVRARGAPRRREVMVLKIVLSHLQIIAMTKNFPLEWPPALNGLFQVFDIMSSAGSSALSTHCLVATSAQETNSSSAYPTPTTSANSTELVITEGYGISDWVFLAQSLGYALAPILLGLFFAVWWTYIVPMYYDTSSDALSAREKTIVSSIVLLIVLQPFLTGAGFEFFSCSDDIDGRSFLEAQFTIQCWVGVHRKWIALGSLMLAFYAIGIPFCAGIILYRVVKRSPTGASRYRRNPSVGVGLVGSASSSEGVGVGIAMDCGSNTASSSVDSRQSFCNEASDNKEVKGAKGLKRSLTSQEPSKRRSVGSVSSLESGETHQTRGSLGSLDPNVHDLKKELAATRRQHEKERLQALNEQHLRYQREREEIDALEKWRPVYGFIYSGYRKECFFWEIVIMTRKALFATISVILRPVGVDIQTYAGLLVLVLAIVLHVHYRPYSMVSKLHFIETLSLSICLLTLMSGLLIYSPNTGIFFKQVNTMLIITSNILFFLYVAFSIRESLRDSARRFYETSRSVVLRRPTIQHVGSSMRSLRLKSDSRSKRLWMRSKRPESTSSQDEATKHGLVHVSTLGLGALEEGSQEDVLSTAGSLSSTPCSGPPTPSGHTPLTATLVSATVSSPTWGPPQSKANTKDMHCMAKKRSSSSCNSLKDDFYGDGADEASFDEDDVYADYLGEEREEEEEVPMEMTSEAEHFVGISYRLQREAERQHRQGNHAAAARTAMLAASTAIEALRQPETSSAGTRSRPVSLSSAGRPLSGRIEADGPYPRSVRGNSRPNSLTSATSSLVGSLKRRLPSFTQKNADGLHVDADGESFGPPIAAERGTSEKPPGKGVARELKREVGVGNDDDDNEEEIGREDDEGVEAQLPPKLVVVSAELAKS